MIALNTREAFLGAADRIAAEKPRLVSIKGMGDVFIREITIGEIDVQIADNADKKDKRAIARGACRLVADENGTQILDPSNEADVDVMAKLPLRILKAINEAADLDKANDSGN